MKINKVEINNYKSCLNTEFNLKTNLTTLIGLNAAGKTNILKAIDLFSRIEFIRKVYNELSKPNTIIKLEIELNKKNVDVIVMFYFDNSNLKLLNTRVIFNLTKN